MIPKISPKVFFVLFICCFAIETFGQDVSFEHKLTIGKTESDSTEYLFSGPKEIVMNSKGHVYIADGNNNSVRIFDKEGIYLNSVGRRGRGPGEFLSIDDLSFDNKNSLYVLDRLSRRVTIFSKTLDDYNTYKINADFTDPFALYPLSSGGHLVFATGSPTNNTKLASTFGNKFREEKRKFLPAYPTLFESNESFFSAIYTSPNYNTVQFGNNYIALCHESFSGKIVVINPLKSHKSLYIIGAWNKSNYNILDWDKRNEYRNRGLRGLVITSRQGGTVYQQIKISDGLVGNEKYLLHFYAQIKDKIILSKVDVYDKDGNLLSTHELTDSDLSLYKNHGKGRVGLVPKHMDEQNHIYFADYTKGIGFPVVRVVKMKIE